MSSIPRTIDKYEILGELGKGAMGTVYKARDPVLDRLVAIKMMSEELVIEEEMRGRFNREARSAAGLQHPNIVTVFDFGELSGGDEAGAPYIVMELLDGVSLAEMMEQAKPMRLAEKIGIVTQICRGLDFAHKRGVIHRDVKPGNIQVLPSGIAKVLDFGIAMGEGSTIKTKTGLVMGTPNYMAPEQISGENVDHRADMWAMGVILFELLTGERPFVASTVPSLVYRIVHATPPPLDARKLGLPEDLVRVVQRVLTKNPDGRYRDLAEVANALDGVMGAPSTRELSREDRAKSYTTNFELARSLLHKGQPGRALEAARRAQALEPTHESVVDLVQEIEIALARMASEDTVVPESKAPEPEPKAFDAARWVERARAMLDEGNRDEAERILNDVLAVDPTFAPANELQRLLDRPAPRAPGPGSGSARSRTYRQRVRDQKTFAEIATFGEPPGMQVLCPGLSPSHVAVGGVDGSVRLWDIDARRKLAGLRTALHQRAGHEALVTSLAFSPDGAFLASGHVDGKIHLWALDTGQELPVRLQHDASIGQVAFSPDGSVLASGGLDQTVKLWDVSLLRQGEAQRRLIRQPAGVTTLAFASGGEKLVTGHTNRILRVHDAVTGRLTSTLRGHGAALTVAVVSPDGETMATAARDCLIRVFDLARSTEVAVLEGHKKAVTALAYFPQGTELASVSMDNGLVIWDLASGARRTTLWGGAEESFSSVAVTGDEPVIVGGLSDGRIRLWAPE